MVDLSRNFLEQDTFSQRYVGLLSGSYQCVDRIVLNGYFRFLQSGGGFRTWWNRVFGSEEKLDQKGLLRFAGHFGRRVQAWARKNDIPIRWVVDLAENERPHEVGESFRPQDATRAGVFCVMVHRAPNSVWQVTPLPKGQKHLSRKRACVNHYAFHIQDRQWGHLTIKVCPHPPFNIQVILNGHEFLACELRRRGIAVIQEGNCFVSSPRLADLQQVAETSRSDALGRLEQVCERWLCSACLCFLMPQERWRERELKCDWSVYQIELSRNLWFQQGPQRDQVFQSVIDHTRQALAVNTIKTVFGRKNRPWRQRGRPAACEVQIERPEYDVTVLKVQLGLRQLKIYSKGEHTLRIEVTIHNVRKEFPRVSVRYAGDIVAQMEAMLTRFLDVLQSVSECWITSGELDRLAQPGQLGAARVAGVDLNRPRLRAVLSAVIALAVDPRGFRTEHVAAKVCERLGSDYTPRQASYDLRKLRAKNLVTTIPGTRRYECPPAGVRSLMALTVLREQILEPLLNGLTRNEPPAPTPADSVYEAARAALEQLMKSLGLAA